MAGIHSNTTEDVSSSSLDLITAQSSTGYRFPLSPASGPSLTLPVLPVSLPSPLHFTLSVLSELSFNEQGRITRHRDICDLKDIIALVPGMHVAQWMAGRMAARGLATVARVGGWLLGTGSSSRSGRREEEEGEKRRKSLGIGMRSDSYVRVGGGGGGGTTEGDFHTASFHGHRDRYASVYSATDTDIIDMTSGRSGNAGQGYASTSTSTSAAPTISYEQQHTSHRPPHLPLYNQQRYAP